MNDREYAAVMCGKQAAGQEVLKLRSENEAIRRELSNLRIAVDTAKRLAEILPPPPPPPPPIEDPSERIELIVAGRVEIKRQEFQAYEKQAMRKAASQALDSLASDFQVEGHDWIVDRIRSFQKYYYS